MAESRQRYRVIKKLDAGGMAEIYLGEMQAVEGFKKRVLPRLTKNKRFVQMFLDEARLSLVLVHANIVQVFDVGRADETYFIVMEFVDGMNLRSILESLKRQKRKFPIELALFVTAEGLRGLAYAHDKVDPESGQSLGIVHRDISPPNTLISKQGEVKLVDFGLAKATNQVLDTDPGVVKGKFSYLAPEAALGKEVDARSDLYGVALVLFEMLTGRRLFLGENDQQTLEQVRQGRVPPLTAIRHEITSDLEQILFKALAHNPDERYQTAHELADALTRYLFAHSLHVTSRDLANLVKTCMSEAEGKATGTDPTGGSVMEALIQQEIVRFTSIEEGGDAESSPEMPRTAPPVHDPGPSGGADLIDTRTWLSDLGGTGSFAKFDDKPQGQAASASAPAASVESSAPLATSPAAAPTGPPPTPSPAQPPPTPSPARPPPTPAAQPPPPPQKAAPAAAVKAKPRHSAPQPAARKSSLAVYSVLVAVALVLGALTAAVVHYWQLR